MPYPLTIKPYGDQAILLEWPNEVDEAILYDILRFSGHLKTNFMDPGVWEMVPAYNSLTLINSEETLDFDVWKRNLKEWYSDKPEGDLGVHYLWKLPVCYDLMFGIDLEEVASGMGVSVPELVAAHTGHMYTVYGIGFLPGFMYLGGLPKSLETPRKETPRLSVSKGSVGLAGRQTGIYPQDSPGGWNIIGKCPIPIFNVKNPDPCFVSIGDKIQFYAITKGIFDLHKIEAEVGIFKIDKTRLDA
jgi:KipI family sensor histidine kinase inhibitor